MEKQKFDKTVDTSFNQKDYQIVLKENLKLRNLALYSLSMRMKTIGSMTEVGKFSFSLCPYYG